MDASRSEYGYDANFVDKPPEIYICTVCQLVLKNPIMIMQCGHRYCAPCFERLKEQSKRMRTELYCPEDRDIIDLSKVCEDHGLRRAVGNLLVKCGECEQGCQWVGELSELETHETSCGYKQRPTMSCSCSQEVKDLKTTVKSLMERLTVFETRFDEKDKELAHVDYRMKELEKRCNDKDKEIGVLKDKNKWFESEALMAKLKDDELLKAANLRKTNYIKLKKEVKDLWKQNDKVVRVLDERIKQLENDNERNEQLRKEYVNLEAESLIHKKQVLLTQFSGEPKYCYISGNNHVQLTDTYSTVVAADCPVRLGSKGYYEVTIEGYCSSFLIGWVTRTFLASPSFSLGNCSGSYAFVTLGGTKCHNGKREHWGEEIEFTYSDSGGGGHCDDSIGVAIDMIQGLILYSKNGNWDAPMGVAFADIDRNTPHFPAIYGLNSKFFVNFGQAEFTFGPPDASFKSLVEL